MGVCDFGGSPEAHTTSRLGILLACPQETSSEPLNVVVIPDGNHHNVLAKGGNAFYADLAGFFFTHLP